MPTSSIPVEIPHCQRCGQEFRCQLNSQGQCACFSISLSETTLANLRQTYEGCLCLKCLQELSTLRN